MSSTSTYTFHMQENMERIFNLTEDRNPMLSDQKLGEKPEWSGNYKPYGWFDRTGIPHSEETIQLMKDSHSTPEIKTIKRKNNKKQFADPVMRKTHADAVSKHSKGRRWVHKGKTNKKPLPEDIDKYLEMGYTMGRYIPKENAFWDYDKTGENNPFWNKKHTGDMSRFSRHNKG